MIVNKLRILFHQVESIRDVDDKVVIVEHFGDIQYGYYVRMEK